MTEPALADTVLEIRTPGGGSYPLEIHPGALGRVGTFCADHAPAHRYAVISDSHVAELYADSVLESLRNTGAGAELVSFPAGEWNKTRAQWAALTDSMLGAGFGRDSAIVALGGGVTGDLGGFVASTYMRGIPIVHVPTSLLSMLDSSVGGKTGVDTEAGKNLVGAFHHPAAVLIDPAVLETLPRHQRCAGMAEAIKTAAILDETLWDWIGSHAADLVKGRPVPSSELIRRVVSHKARVVEEDPGENGVRGILNFGHTVGHALEALEGYTLLHGEAVAAGMRVEARLGELLGITRPGTVGRLSAVLEACNLDGGWEEAARPEAVAEAMTRDKKSRQQSVRCVFLARIGEVALDPEGAHTFPLRPQDLGAPLAAALRPASEA